jgi:hypothetical protein
MMIAGASDLVEIVTGSSSSVDITVDYRDLSAGVVTPGYFGTNVAAAQTTTVVAAPGASISRNVKEIIVRNKGAAANDITVRHKISGTSYEVVKITLQPGDSLEYKEGVGYVYVTTPKLDAKLRVAADVANSTTSAADITGLTCPVKSGKHYNFEARLMVLSAATGTGVQLSVNGPTMTNFRVTAHQVVTGSATAAAVSAPVADITTVDGVIITQTTGPANVVPMDVFGWLNPSADGTFAMRLRSEVAASAVTVKAGSWCRIWEADA